MNVKEFISENSDKFENLKSLTNSQFKEHFDFIIRNVKNLDGIHKGLDSTFTLTEEQILIIVDKSSNMISLSVGDGVDIKPDGKIGDNFFSHTTNFFNMAIKNVYRKAMAAILSKGSSYENHVHIRSGA